MVIMILAPCRDHRALAMGKAGTQQVHAAVPGSGQEDDDCSPLCTCSCCASVSSMIYVPVVVGAALVPVVKKFSLYIAPDYNAERSVVWQPPRIG